MLEESQHLRPKHKLPADSHVAQAELAVADTIGQLMQFWGFKRPMGRIWAVLYLSPRPLKAAELGSLLQMSAGSVSMTLNELLRWGAVNKTWQPGDRSDLFEAETRIWKLVRRVVAERELELVKQFTESLERAEAALGRETLPNEQDRRFKKERIEQLTKLSKLGEGLLSALVAGHAVDPATIQQASSDS